LKNSDVYRCCALSADLKAVAIADKTLKVAYEEAARMWLRMAHLAERAECLLRHEGVAA